MNTMKMRGLAAAVLATTLLLAGCGGDGDEKDSEAPRTPAASQSQKAGGSLDSEVPDLCTLFTAEDFQAEFGEQPDAPESQGQVGAIRGTCTFSARAGFPMVFLGAYNETDREATMAMVEAEQVDDLAVTTYWDDTVGLIVPLAGKDWYLQVKVAGTDADKETSIKFAKALLDRL